MVNFLKVLVCTSAIFVLHSALSILNIGVPPLNIHSGVIIYTFFSILSFWFFVCLFIFVIFRVIIDSSSKRIAKIPVKISGLIVAFQISHFIALEIAIMPNFKILSVFVAWMSFIFLIYMIFKLVSFFSSESKGAGSIDTSE